MKVYYNEIDPIAAAWLRELMKAGEIPEGEIDERSIADVRPDDLRGFAQCHFFAGIGGWSHALRLAGWDDARPVWTGSCPCQPFSAAGKRKGTADRRHLWPAFFNLIRQCRPDTIFGEQVEAAIRLGWLDGIRADLEGEGYVLGAAVLGAHSVGAPHIRQRLWWVADAERDTGGARRSANQPAKGTGTETAGTHAESGRRGVLGWLGHSDEPRPQGRLGTEHPERAGERAFGQAGAYGFWSDAEWLQCRDGKARRVEPGIFPLAHGVPNRVGLLRGAGNAIVPQVAQAFIEAYLQTKAVPW